MRERRMASLPAQKRFDRSASACYCCITLTANVEQTKRCYACELEKSLDDFGIDKSKRSGISYRCKDCTRIATAQWRKDNPEKVRITRKQNYERKKECPEFIERRKAYNEKWYRANSGEVLAIAKQKRTGKEGCLKTMLYCAKSRAKEKAWDFDLDMDYLMSIATDHCPVDNKPFDWNRERELTANGDFFDYSIPSIDRTDSSKGYVKGNIAIIGDKWNRWKSNMELNDLLLLTQYVQSVTKK